MFLHCTELWHSFAKKNKPVTDIVTKCWDGFDLQGNLQPPFLFNVPPLDCFQAKKIVQQKWEHRNVHFCCNPKVRETRMNLCAFGRLCVCVCEGTRFILKCVPQYRGALHHIVPDRQSAGLNTKQQEAPLHTAPIQPYRTQWHIHSLAESFYFFPFFTLLIQVGLS